MADWTPIRGDRLMREDPRGFTVIRPAGNDPTIPLECPTCTLEMRVQTDRDSYRHHGCCTDCAVMWATGPNTDRWANGWRPDPEQVADRAEIRRSSPFTPRL